MDAYRASTIMNLNPETYNNELSLTLLFLSVYKNAIMNNYRIYEIPVVSQDQKLAKYGNNNI